MAAVDYVALPLAGSADTSVKVHKNAIIDVRVAKGGSVPEKWVVRITVLPGTWYNLQLAGTPFATQALAEAARDEWLASY